MKIDPDRIRGEREQGAASFETARSNAAVLLLALGGLFVGIARAGDVMLDVAVVLNQQKLGQRQLVARQGKSAEIEFEEQVRLYVNPIVTQNGGILLSMRVEVPSGSRWSEVAEPRIMVVDGNEGTVKVTSPKGKVIEIAIRPRRM